MLTVRQMAKELGCSVGLVSRYSGRGMPMNDADAARRWTMANVRPELRNTKRAEALGETGHVDYQEARARREHAEARLAELKLLEQQGQLVGAADVSTELTLVFANFREAMMQIPARLSAVLCAETDEARVNVLLTEEIRDALLKLKAKEARQ